MPYYMHELNPDYNPATRLLRDMTTSELQMLLNKDEFIEDLVMDLQQVKSADSERNLMLESNKSLAESNLSQEPLLDELKVKISELNEELNGLKVSLETKKQRLDELTRQMSLDTTLALIQASAAEAEEESEAFSENFLSGEIQVDTFLESYLSKRKLTHLRRVKAEKMAELLNQAAANRNQIAPISRTGSSSSSSRVTPYPTELNPYMPYPFYPSNQGQSMYPMFQK